MKHLEDKVQTEQNMNMLMAFKQNATLYVARRNVQVELKRMARLDDNPTAKQDHLITLASFHKFVWGKRQAIDVELTNKDLRGLADLIECPFFWARKENSSSSSSIREGDKVEAKCAGWTKFYKGEVTAVNSRDGTYDIKFEDGERKRGVEKSRVRSLDSGSNEKNSNIQVPTMGFSFADNVFDDYVALGRIFAAAFDRDDKKTVEPFVKGIFDHDSALSVAAKLPAMRCSGALWKEFLNSLWKGKKLESSKGELKYQSGSDAVMKRLQATSYHAREEILAELSKHDPPK